MDINKVRVLALSAGSHLELLSPRHRALVETNAFWNRLVETPEDSLDEEQLGLLSAIGVDLERE